MIYDHLIYGCVYKQTNSTANIESGYACQTSSNCSPGLVCTADFVCLTGFGGSCISDTECANSLKCASNGTCGCEVFISLIDNLYFFTILLHEAILHY